MAQFHDVARLQGRNRGAVAGIQFQFTHFERTDGQVPERGRPEADGQDGSGRQIHVGCFRIKLGPVDALFELDLELRREAGDGRFALAQQ